MTREIRSRRRAFLHKRLRRGRCAAAVGLPATVANRPGSRRCSRRARRCSRTVSHWVGRKAMAQEFSPADHLADVSQQRHRVSRYGRRIARLVDAQFSDLRAERRRTRRAAALVLARRVARAAVAHADHAPRLRRRLERDRASGKARDCRRCSTKSGRSPRRATSMFYCADPMEADGTGFYYESIDLEDAFHEQTILAYDLNDAALPVAERRAAAPARRAAARLQARQVRDAHRARRQLRDDRRRQGRLLGGRRLSVVCRDLVRMAVA